MLKIFEARLNACEYQPIHIDFDWAEACECEYGHEWNGNVAGYVANLDIDGDNYAVVTADECEHSIVNVPADGALVLVDNSTGYPVEMYWAADVDGEWYFPDDEHVDSVFGSDVAMCLSAEEIERLAGEWEMDVDELMSQMHPATPFEISRYGF